MQVVIYSIEHIIDDILQIKPLCLTLGNFYIYCTCTCNSYKMGMKDLPDMYAQSLRAYISGKS